MSKIIVMFQDEDKELNMSLYDFVDEQYQYSNPMMVCHVTEEEYKIMLKQIKNGGLNERLPRIARDELGYNKFAYLLAYNPACDNIVIANYNNLEQIGNYVVDQEGLHYDKNGIQFPKDLSISRFLGRGLKIYTTESYNDVIAHYTSYPKIKRITLTTYEIKRFEAAYKKLSKSLNPNDFSESDLKEVRVLLSKIIDKCDQ